MRKEVGIFEAYKSQSCQAAQISKRYGPGIHFMVPNNKQFGAGKSKTLCTLEEFNKHNMGINDVDLDNVWKELSYFVKEVPTKNVFDYK